MDSLVSPLVTQVDDAITSCLYLDLEKKEITRKLGACRKDLRNI